jgi:hypothetical protein
MAPNLETLHVTIGTEHFEWAGKTPRITLPALKSLHLTVKEPIAIEKFYEALECPRLDTLTLSDGGQLYKLADTHSVHLHTYYPGCINTEHFIFNNRLALGNLTALEFRFTEFGAIFFETLQDLQLGTALNKIVLQLSYPMNCSATKAFSRYIRWLILESNGGHLHSNILQTVSIRCLRRWLGALSLKLFEQLRDDFPNIVKLETEYLVDDDHVDREKTGVGDWKCNSNILELDIEDDHCNCDSM